MKFRQLVSSVAVVVCTAVLPAQDWVQVYETRFADAAQDHFIGDSVDVAGGKAIVGSSPGTNTLRKLSSGAWEEHSSWDSSHPEYWRSAVAMSGDGFAFAGGADATPGSLRLVHVLQQVAVVWGEAYRLYDSGSTSSTYFGNSMGAHDDLLIVGAPYGNGEAFIYRRDAAGVYQQEGPSLLSVTPTFSSYGSDVDITDAVVGAHAIVADEQRLSLDDGTHDSTGAVDIYRFDSTTGTWVLDVTLWGSAPGDHFGRSVAISGRHAVIGATGVVGPGGEQGCIYVYRRASRGVWELQAQLFADNLTDHLGYAVDIDGTRIIAGAPLPFDTEPGAAFVFQRSVATWSQEARLSGIFTDAGDRFGDSVAIDDDGEVIVVGAPKRDQVSGIETGSAFVFERRTVTGPTLYGHPANTLHGPPLMHAPIARRAGSFPIGLNGLLPRGSVFLLVGRPRDQWLPLEPMGGQPGSHLFVDPIASLVLAADGNGEAHANLQIPGQVRIDLMFQAFVIDRELPYALPLAHTPGLRLQR